jgi:hypothetical protein
MPIVRLIREVREPTGRGPGNGQFALQRALRRLAPPWLEVGGQLRQGEVPWFWSWEDRETAALCARTGQPLVVGPNILFADSRHPCRIEAEREICQAASCRLLFTESHWYADLIEAYRGPANRAPIVVWPYPIDPAPGGPLPVEFDLMVYEKSGVCADTLQRLSRLWPRQVRVRYGRYRREKLLEAARRSRCCLYLSDDDRGPLALAEILLAGCPVVGIPRGAPFVRHRSTGIVLERFEPEVCRQAVVDCHQLDRQAVAAEARAQFDTPRIVGTIVQSLVKSV